MSAELPEGQMTLFEPPTTAGKKEKLVRKIEAKEGQKQSKTKKTAAPDSASTTRRAMGKPKKTLPPKNEKVLGPRGGKGLSGLVPEGDVRLTANMREDLHLRLKIAAARQRTTIGEILEELVEKHIK